MATISTEEAQTQLNKLFVGARIQNFSIQDWWVINFINGITVLSNNFFFEGEKDFANKLFETFPELNNSSQSQDIPKAVSVMSKRDKVVLKVEVLPDNELKLIFEDQSSIVFKTDVTEVDWQWVVTPNYDAPYHRHLIACFCKESIDANVHAIDAVLSK